MLLTSPTRLAGVVTSLTLLVGGIGLAPAQAAGPSLHAATAAPTVDRAGPKPLRITAPGVSCECGGAGYLWGWSVVGMRYKGAREGHTYRAFVKGGGRASSTGFGYASFSVHDHDFEHGKTYRFVVKEFKRKKQTRTSKAVSYTIPTPVAHPELARLDTIEADGQDYLVAGRTHSVSYEGAWQDGAQFAKGVDRYLTADGGFGGYYEEEGYPLPWTEHAPDASLTLSPTDEHLGQSWNIYVVGSRPAPKDVPRKGIEAGDPVRGSEWGHRWFVTIISEEQAAALQP